MSITIAALLFQRWDGVYKVCSPADQRSNPRPGQRAGRSHPEESHQGPRLQNDLRFLPQYHRGHQRFNHWTKVPERVSPLNRGVVPALLILIFIFRSGRGKDWQRAVIKRQTAFPCVFALGVRPSSAGSTGRSDHAPDQTPASTYGPVWWHFLARRQHMGSLPRAPCESRQC